MLVESGKKFKHCHLGSQKINAFANPWEASFKLYKQSLVTGHETRTGLMAERM